MTDQIFLLAVAKKTLRASLEAQLVNNPSAMQEIQFDFWVRKIHWRRDSLPTPAFLGLPSGSDGKESTCSVGDLGWSLGWEDPMEEGMATHSSILAWRMDSVHGVTQSWTWQSNYAQHKKNLRKLYLRPSCSLWSVLHIHLYFSFSFFFHLKIFYVNLSL